MRKNPYNKKLKDRLPLFMQGPSMTTALITNEGQKVALEKSMIPPLHKYKAEGVSFTMVQPPFLNPNGTVNPLNILNTEMGQTEVTQELFEVVMGRNRNGSRHKNSPQNPVEMLTWFDCIAFCNTLSELLGLPLCYEMSDIEMSYVGSNIISAKVAWDEAANGFRLPESEEWQSFAKAGTQNRWAGTDDPQKLERYAWCKKNSGNEIHPVGEKLPNAWGLYDMTGNVREWCWDKYKGTAYNRRVIHGGSVKFDADDCLVSVRTETDAHYRTDHLGFRICRTIK